MLAEIGAFVNWVRRRNPEARTWRDYECDLKLFFAAVGDCAPGEITPSNIDEFVISQAALGRKASTINRRLATIASLYTYLSDEDPSLICPVLPRRHALKQPQRLPRPVQAEDVDEFFAAMERSPTGIRDRAIFMLMLRCGLRICETAHLRLADLYLGEDHPRLLVHGKASKERSVYLSPQAEQALRAYLTHRPATACDFVFLSYLGRGMSTTAIHKRLMRYRAQAGVKVTAHRLRHTFANDLVCAGVPVTSIQKLLGHAWLETTQTYVEANDPQVRDDFYAASLRVEGWQ
jgi:site-specific recombinase XerD